MYKKTSYDYVKKCRALKRLKFDSSSTSSKSSLDSTKKSTKLEKKTSSIDVANVECSKNIRPVSDAKSDCNHENINCIESEVENNSCSTEVLTSTYQSETTSNKPDTSNKSDSMIMEIECQVTNLTLKEKLQDWCINNIFILRNSTTTQLLKILCSEGHDELPKTAETLLKTKKFSNETRIMQTAKLNNGLYTYFGIVDVLNMMINPEVYSDERIEILVNIDGMPIYKNSDKQFWPILIKIYHENFVCKPGIVAIYCGDSKPHSIDDFMQEFITESNKLTEHGLIICNKQYTYSLKGLLCDTPARAACKRCKGHGGFYACERCVVKGITFNRRRVYSRIDCPLRTKESFLTKTQPEHHKDGISPLTLLTGFDPVRQVFLDSMHLFNLGVMKSLLEKFIESGNPNKLSASQRKSLNDLFQKMTPGIPMEFQRKSFDLKNLNNWKATQFQFVILYALPFLFKKILSTKKYKHLLLLFVASRILFSQQLAVQYVDYADELLRKFFILMPTMYGKDTQVMNFHNLIHVADDVRYMKAPLSAYSAFPFESCLGQIKKLIRTPSNPLVQVSRRLHEMQAGTSIYLEQKKTFSDCLAKNLSFSKSISKPKNFDTEVLQVKYKESTIRSKAPDNFVRLNNNDLFEINRLFFENKKLKIQGHVVRSESAFDYPRDSKFVGVERIVRTSKHLKTFNCDQISSKCLKLNFGESYYSIQMLHM